MSVRTCFQISDSQNLHAFALIWGIILTPPEKKKIISILNKSENATCDCNVSAKGNKTGNKDAHSS